LDELIHRFGRIVAVLAQSWSHLADSPVDNTLATTCRLCGRTADASIETGTHSYQLAHIRERAAS
jgi:hypothetical protein